MLETYTFSNKWEGTFTQLGANIAFEIENMKIDTKGVVSGECIDSIGPFYVEGCYKGAKIEFDKIYQSSKQTTCFSATSEDGVNFSGSWVIENIASDRFKLRLKAPDWTGWTKDPTGEKVAFKNLSINVGIKEMFGLGSDMTGNFIINGYVKRESASFSFIKQYVGKKDMIFYNGSILSDSNAKKMYVKGTWLDDKNKQGTFKLRQT